jgi:hypothetical protein
MHSLQVVKAGTFLTYSLSAYCRETESLFFLELRSGSQVSYYNNPLCCRQLSLYFSMIFIPFIVMFPLRSSRIMQLSL